jgi:hypothetical protein
MWPGSPLPGSTTSVRSDKALIQILSQLDIDRYIPT